MRRTCDTRHASGGEAFVYDAALDVGRELAVEVGWAQVEGDGVGHMSRRASEWAARRYRTLLHGVANWNASGNEAGNPLDDDGVALESENERQSSTVSASGSAAGSSSGGNAVGGSQEIVGGWQGWASACCW